MCCAFLLVVPSRLQQPGEVAEPGSRLDGGSPERLLPARILPADWTANGHGREKSELQGSPTGTSESRDRETEAQGPQTRVG